MKRLIFLVWVFSSFAMQTKEDLSVALQQLNQNLLVLEDKLKISEKKPIIDVFTSLEKFSNLLDTFSKFPSEGTLDQLLEMVFTELTFEGFETLELPKLREFKIALSKVYEKIIRIQKNIRNHGVDMVLQEEFNESLLGTFKAEKDLIDAYITQKNVEFQQTLFDTSIKNVRITLERFKKEPTWINLLRIGNAIKFNLKFLDVVENLKDLADIFLRYNTLVKEFEDTFSEPNEGMLRLTKKMTKPIMMNIIKKDILDPLRKAQQDFREYIKNRLEAMRKEKNK